MLYVLFVPNKKNQKVSSFRFFGARVAAFAESPAPRDRIEWRFRALMPHPSLSPEKSGGHELSIPIYYSVTLHGCVVVVPSDLRERVEGRCYVWELRSTVVCLLSRVLCGSAGMDDSTLREIALTRNCLLSRNVLRSAEEGSVRLYKIASVSAWWGAVMFGSFAPRWCVCCPECFAGARGGVPLCLGVALHGGVIAVPSVLRERRGGCKFLCCSGHMY